jgi:hypothetical protein
MSTERALGVPEHPVADLEGRDVTANGLDLSRELVPRTVTLGLMSPLNNLRMKGLAAPVTAVRPIHCRRVNLDEHLVVPGRRLVHVRDPNHVRRAVSGVDCRLHGPDCSDSTN